MFFLCSVISFHCQYLYSYLIQTHMQEKIFLANFPAASISIYFCFLMFILYSSRMAIGKLFSRCIKLCSTRIQSLLLWATFPASFSSRIYIYVKNSTKMAQKWVVYDMLGNSRTTSTSLYTHKHNNLPTCHGG